MGKKTGTQLRGSKFLQAQHSLQNDFDNEDLETPFERGLREEGVTETIVKKLEIAAEIGDVDTVSSILGKFKGRWQSYLSLLLTFLSEDSRYPLHLAAANNRASVVKAILEAVKDDQQLLQAVLWPNNKDVTPWQLAVKNDCKEVINTFLDFVGNNVELLKVLIASREPKHANDHPSNPLSGLAAKDNKEAITRILDVAKTDKVFLGKLLGPNEAGITPLYSAKMWGKTAVVGILREFGAEDEEVGCSVGEDEELPLGEDIRAKFVNAVSKGDSKELERILTYWLKTNPCAIEELFGLNEKNDCGQTVLDIARMERDAEEHNIEAKVEGKRDRLGDIEDMLLNKKNPGSNRVSQCFVASKHENRNPTKEPSQRLLNLIAVVKVLETAMASTAIPEQVQGSIVDASQIKLGQHPEALFALSVGRF